MRHEKIYDVILRPVHTEKASLAADLSKYVFFIHQKANKSVVKKAVQTIFDVEVSAVNILNSSSKKKIFKGVKGLKRRHKKAVVTLKAGSVIDFMKIGLVG